MTGIYKITSPSKRIYIGSTNNFERRISEYKYLCCKEQTRLYNSFVKYGYDTHKIELIEECSIAELFNKERYWQEYYDVLDRQKGLNCQYVSTDNASKVMSKETKLKISKSLSGDKNPRYGKKLAKETKEKISKANKGRIQSKELNQAQSERMLGNRHSKLSKKVLDTNTGITYDSVNKAAIALNINYSTLKCYLNNKFKNKTTLKYA